MSAVARTAFRLHRWLAWAVGLQVLVWVTSGVLFAWLPFEPWVKGGDALGTRVYLDGEGGDFLAIRNEAWVWYDFFWRLHIMDYRGGEDFNNALLRALRRRR